MKKLLLLTLGICVFQTAFCQSVITKDALIISKTMELRNKGYEEINVNYYFCGFPVSEKAMIGIINTLEGQKIHLVLTLSVPSMMDLTISSIIPARAGFVERNNSYRNATGKIEYQYKYMAVIEGRTFYFDLPI